MTSISTIVRLNASSTDIDNARSGGIGNTETVTERFVTGWRIIEHSEAGRKGGFFGEPSLEKIRFREMQVLLPEAHY